MIFISFEYLNIVFIDSRLIQRFYTIGKRLSNTRQVKIINKKEFVKIALYRTIKIFKIYISFSGIDLIKLALII